MDYLCNLDGSGLLASRISRKIVEPLNQLDLENPDNNESYDELAPLLTKISFQQKTIQRQLLQAKQQQEDLQMITNYMKEGILLIDNKGEILSGNTSALKILGISPNLQIFIGKHKRIFWRSTEVNHSAKQWMRCWKEDTGRQFWKRMADTVR